MTQETEIQEKFCPRCYDYHPGEIEYNQLHDVAGWFCCNCGYAAPPERVPHDADECDEWIETGYIKEPTPRGAY